MKFPDTATCEKPVDFALRYAQAGIPLFPVQMVRDDNEKYTKRPHPMLKGAPRGEGGYKQATTDLDQIRQWWGQDPTAAIGWYPGGCGLVVLDADGPDGVRELYNVSEGDLDNTTTVQIRTSGKGGGRHAVFDRGHREGVIGNGSLIGVQGESRGDKGYAMLPDGRDYYTFDSDTLDVARLPDWAERLLPWPREGDARTSIADVTSDDERLWTEAHSAPEHSPDGKRILKATAETIEDAVAGDQQRGRHPTMTSSVGRILSYAQNHPREFNLFEAHASLRTVYVAQFIDMHESEQRGKGFDRFWSYAVALRVAEDDEENLLSHEPTKSKALPIGLRFNDVDNSLRLIHMHGGRLRYVIEWGIWIVWDGTRWLKDPKRVAVFELAKDVSSALYRQAAENPDAAKEIAKWANLSATRSRIASMVELARGIEGVVISQMELDTDPWAFGVANGWIDLHTGTFHEPDPEKLMTMQAAVAYDPNAEAPRWRQGMGEWFPDEETRRYVQRLSGHALSGDPLGDHIFVIHHGDGRNGKGTFMRVHKHVLGDYYVTPDKSLLVQKRHEQHATVKARLYRARLAVASETDQRERLNEAQVKNFTGGDPINARRMREDEWEFDPTHSLWLQTNYLPEISGSDTGIWSRIRVVSWTVSFEGHTEGDLDTRLTTEASGVLNWMIEGCLDWQEHGLDEPEFVVRATLDYRATEDVLAHFARDSGLVFETGQSLVDSVLKQRISGWATDEGVDMPSAKSVNAWMKSNGCRESRENYTKNEGTTSKRKVWKGAHLTVPYTATDVRPPVPGRSGRTIPVDREYSLT